MCCLSTDAFTLMTLFFEDVVMTQQLNHRKKRKAASLKSADTAPVADFRPESTMRTIGALEAIAPDVVPITSSQKPSRGQRISLDNY